MRDFWKLISGSVSAWSNENALEWGAALAYYTAFSIAPLLIIALSIVGLFYQPKLYAERRRAKIKPVKGAEAATRDAKQRERGEIPASDKPKIA